MSETGIQKAVLAMVNKVCTIDSGYYTREIAERIGRQPGHESNRQHSALVGRELRALEQAGLVGRLDDKKPVVWTRAKEKQG